ncbi:helix-turn-helix domain-containing protein [Paucibacter sp. AS339]|uniref:helix-turn-helix transcriptional regulator n=1 Tax=Paucibacter hankyongi TaxID=3133434 RepID=UPI0030AE6874
MEAPKHLGKQTRSEQPLHALQLPDALLKMQTVTQATGLSSATIYRKVAAGELPIVKMGKRCTRFRAADVRAFIQAQRVAA